ncbi:unnamed protein product [Paramecium octaurelia]|uniref:Uncharacterized protein n=1 Tax=Paramecium octaurelia TaxID=43137 RepID=A0A8S1TLZ6_PAROT|nr:unnamed protein product [Paramecium octaurelia]
MQLCTKQLDLLILFFPCNSQNTHHLQYLESDQRFKNLLLHLSLFLQQWVHQFQQYLKNHRMLLLYTWNLNLNRINTINCFIEVSTNSSSLY